MTLDEPRKATDILLAVEAMLTQVLGEVRAQNLNSKLMLNKMNALLAAKTENASAPEAHAAPAPKLSVEADYTFTPASESLPLEDSPLGFRRTSRPETFATEKQMAQVNKPVPPPPPKAAVPQPKPKAEELSMPHPYAQEVDDWKTVSMPALPKMQSEEAGMNIGRVSVEQRVVDKNGKAIFLANVEIINKATNKPETKTRTTSTGKWQAVLPPGSYDVKITKSESMSKEKVEFRQEITVDSKNPTHQLPLVMAK